MFGRFLFDKNPTCMIVSNQKININMMRLLDYARSDSVYTYKIGRKSSLTLAQDAPAGSLCRRYAPYDRSDSVSEKSNQIISSHLDRSGEVSTS